MYCTVCPMPTCAQYAQCSVPHNEHIMYHVYITEHDTGMRRSTKKSLGLYLCYDVKLARVSLCVCVHARFVGVCVCVSACEVGRCVYRCVCA